MPPVTRANKKRRGEIERWRCGSCLFELADHLMPTLFDLPFETKLIQDHEPLEEPRIIKKRTLEESASRGCRICIFIKARLPHHARDLWWRPGGLEDVFSRCILQLFMAEPQTSALKPLNIHPFINFGGFPSGDTGSPNALATASGWIRKCLESHSKCAAKKDPAPMPDRILFIEDIETMKVRLIEDAKSLPTQQYVCLSHRWGPDTKALSLTKDRAQHFQASVPSELLYPQLEDAFKVCHELGFGYIWVDSLCIYQDDVKDWHAQASEMASIYENAVFTISATHRDPNVENGGLFCRSSLRDSTLETFKVGEETIFSRKSSFDEHLFSVGFRDSPISIPETSEFSLLQRGWVFQERLLSRRTVYFTKREIYWECREAFWCECRHQERLLCLRKTQIPGLTAYLWEEIVEDYSRKTLSYESDKLPALSGVARRYGEARGWTFLAGLWLEELPAQLLWRPLLSNQRLNNSGLPSWSWASTRSSVSFQARFSPLISVVSCNVEYSSNPFGIPETVKLQVRGPCISAKLIRRGNDVACPYGGTLGLILQDCRRDQGLNRNKVFNDVSLDLFQLQAPVLFLLGDVPESGVFIGLVLRSAQSSGGSFERIGFVLSDYFHEDEGKYIFKELRARWKVRTLRLV